MRFGKGKGSFESLFKWKIYGKLTVGKDNKGTGYGYLWDQIKRKCRKWDTYSWQRGGGGGGGSGKIVPVQVVLSNGKLRYRYLTVNMIIVGRDRIRTTDIVPLPRVGTIPYINVSIQLLVSLRMQFTI
jgi:hypothetical protein